MITKFGSLFAGHVDLDDEGLDGTPVNDRWLSDEYLAMLGDGGYDPGARARQIRNGLLAVDKVDYEDVRRIHLDDRAILMERWRDLVLRVVRSAPANPLHRTTYPSRDRKCASWG